MMCAMRPSLLRSSSPPLPTTQGDRGSRVLLPDRPSIVLSPSAERGHVLHRFREGVTSGNHVPILFHAFLSTLTLDRSRYTRWRRDRCLRSRLGVRANCSFV